LTSPFSTIARSRSTLIGIDIRLKSISDQPPYRSSHDEMNTAADLDQEMEKLEARLPNSAAALLRWLRDPSARWLRIPIGMHPNSGRADRIPANTRVLDGPPRTSNDFLRYSIFAETDGEADC
jgi:hypothetical protein